MNELIYLGEMPSRLNFQISFIQSAYNSILVLIGRLLGSETFIQKSKIKDNVKWNELFVSIHEELITASLIKKQKWGNEFNGVEENKSIKSLTLEEIKSFPSFEGGHVIPFTIITHNCDPEMSCPTCKGSGECPDCNGERYVVCDVCGGEKLCTSCNGSGRYPCFSCEQSGICNCCDGDGEEECDNCDGDGWVWAEVECNACNGTGLYQLRSGRYVPCKACRGTGIHHREKEDCDECEGDGTVVCHNCKGDGKCPKCNGEGNVECRACNGSGKCGKCKGKGKLRCKTCNASGGCPRCDGTGNIKCTKCNGTGYYQTFDTCKLTHISKDSNIYNNESEVIGCKAIKKNIYRGRPFIIEFSKLKSEKGAMFTIQEILNEYRDNKFLNKIIEYRDKIIDSDGNSKIPENQCLKTTINIESLSILKLSVSFSNEDFVFYIVGENQAVYCDKKPTIWDRFWAAIL